MTDRLPSVPQESSKEKEPVVLSLAQLETLASERKLEAAEYERREALMQIRDGLQTLKQENPKLKTESFYKQLEILLPSMAQKLSYSIFDISGLSDKGVSRFNQLVDANKAAELSSLICFGVGLLNTASERYQAPQEVLVALEKNLSDLGSVSPPLVIQAKPGVLRVLLNLNGQTFTWDCSGSLNVKKSQGTEKVASTLNVQEPEAILESPVEEDAFEEEEDRESLSSLDNEIEIEQPEIPTPQGSGLFEGSENDSPAQRADRWKQYIGQTANEDRMSAMKVHVINDQAGVLNDDEKAAIDQMSYDDFVEYASGPYMDTVAEKNPDFMMSIDG